MAYVRKTVDEYNVECFYPWSGWEEVTSAETMTEACSFARDYRQNDQYAQSVRVVKRRVKKESVDGNDNS